MTEKVDQEGQDDGYRRAEEKLTFGKAFKQLFGLSIVIILISIGHALYHIMAAMWLGSEAEPLHLASFGLAALT